jgi:hypothetical protein
MVYIQRDDLLLITAQTRLPNDTVTFNLRHLRVPELQGGQPSDGGAGKTTGRVITKGIVEPMQQQFVLTAAVPSATRIVQMGEGYLLSLGCSAQLANVRGQTFARAILVRPTGIAASETLPLFGDYVTLFGGSGYPVGRFLSASEGPGWIHSIQVANPSAGADWTFTLPPQQRLRLDSFNAVFTASATVANRLVQVIVDDGVNTVWTDDLNAAITASQVVNVSVTQTNIPTGAVTTILHAVVPPGVILPGNWRLRTSTGAIQAGDQWSAIWLNVEEWVDQVG